MAKSTDEQAEHKRIKKIIWHCAVAMNQLELGQGPVRVPVPAGKCIQHCTAALEPA